MSPYLVQDLYFATAFTLAVFNYLSNRQMSFASSNLYRRHNVFLC